MTRFTRGYEFNCRGNTYKVTEGGSDRFMAIWVGQGEYRDTVTYYGYTRNGDFRLDNVLFRQSRNGRPVQVHGATGVLGLDSASQEYLNAVFA